MFQHLDSDPNTIYLDSAQLKMLAAQSPQQPVATDCCISSVKMLVNVQNSEKILKKTESSLQQRHLRSYRLRPSFRAQCALTTRRAATLQKFSENSVQSITITIIIVTGNLEMAPPGLGPGQESQTTPRTSSLPCVASWRPWEKIIFGQNKSVLVSKVHRPQKIPDSTWFPCQRGSGPEGVVLGFQPLNDLPAPKNNNYCKDGIWKLRILSSHLFQLINYPRHHLRHLELRLRSVLVFTQANTLKLSTAPVSTVTSSVTLKMRL